MSKDKNHPVDLIESAGIPKIKKAPGKAGSSTASGAKINTSAIVDVSGIPSLSVQLFQGGRPSILII